MSKVDTIPTEEQEKAEEEYFELVKQGNAEADKAEKIVGCKYIEPCSRLLKKAHPNYTQDDIIDRIYLDFRGRWERSYIYTMIDSSLHNDANVKGAVKGWKTRNAKKLEISNNLFEKALEEAPEPPDITMPEREQEERSDHRILTVYGRITEACDKLWAALTEEDVMPHFDEDLTIEHIKPTRDFRRTIAFETAGNQLPFLDHRLECIDAVVTDMRKLINE